MQFLKKYVRLVIATVLLIILLIFPPVYLYEFYPFITCAVIAIVLGYLIVSGFESPPAVARVNQYGEVIEPPKDNFTIFGTFIASVIIGIFVAVWCHYRLESLFKNEGILIKDAQITDGRGVTHGGAASKSGDYNIELTYKLKSGTRYNPVLKVESEIFESVYKDQNIDLLYLPGHPDIIRLLLGSNVKKYLKREHRAIEATDIDSIFKYNDLELLKFLNRTSYRWHADTLRGQTIYNNNLTIENVGKFPDRIVYSRTGLISGEDYLSELKPKKKESPPPALTGANGNISSTLHETEKYMVQTEYIREQDNHYTTVMIFEKK
ncbi:hypothetical protein [Emticicia fontis]